MAIQLGVVAPGAFSPVLRVKVGGQLTAKGRVSAVGWTGDVLTVYHSPTGTDAAASAFPATPLNAYNWIVLGTIPSGGGDLVIDDPVNNIRVGLGAAAVGNATTWYEPGL